MTKSWARTAYEHRRDSGTLAAGGQRWLFEQTLDRAVVEQLTPRMEECFGDDPPVDAPGFSFHIGPDGETVEWAWARVDDDKARPCVLTAVMKFDPPDRLPALPALFDYRWTGAELLPDVWTPAKVHREFGGDFTIPDVGIWAELSPESSREDQLLTSLTHRVLLSSREWFLACHPAQLQTSTHQWARFGLTVTFDADGRPIDLNAQSGEGDAELAGQCVAGLLPELGYPAPGREAQVQLELHWGGQRDWLASEHLRWIEVGLLGEQKKFEKCYGDDPLPEDGELVVSITVGPHGALREAIIESEISDERGACIIEALRRINFPARGYELQATAPINFGDGS